MKINKPKKYVSFFNRLLFGILLCGAWSLSGQQAQATEAIDQQMTGVGGLYTGTIIGQSFTPAVNNISKIRIAIGSFGFSGTATGTLYLCLGIPDTATPANNLNCAGSGQTKITQTNFTATWAASGISYLDITLPGSYPLTPELASYFFVINNENGILIRYESGSNQYARGALFTAAGAVNYDQTFYTYYETGAPTITIGAPTANQTYATNELTFYGTTSNADTISIYYGPLNTSPANLLLGQSIYNRRTTTWSFDAQIADGAWTIWHIATQGTTTVTSTSTVYVSNQYGQNDAAPISSSTMATTSAYAVLTGAKTECGSSAPAYIYSPTSFWASNTPEILTNGSASASTSPFLYQVITTPLYTIGKGPIDIGNKVSCYLSTQSAGEKGQALAITLLAYANMLSGLNTLFFGNFPIGALLLIWGIGMILWMLRKVVPFGK